MMVAAATVGSSDEVGVAIGVEVDGLDAGDVERGEA